MDNTNITIEDVFELPSKGKLYGTDFNPVFSMRSMTTNEEMRRLHKSDRPYKIMASIIDDCIIDNHFGMSCYDMCLGDYQYLLHKLRTVTYGGDYHINTTCPVCGTPVSDKIDITQMPIKTIPDNYDDYIHITLPRSKRMVTLNFETPRLLDNVSVQSKERRRKSPEMEGDPSLIYSIVNLIKEVDGERFDQLRLENFVRNLAMADSNYIINKSDKFTNSIGIDTMMDCMCTLCGYEYESPFRITGEFFRPQTDE